MRRGEMALAIGIVLLAAWGPVGTAFGAKSGELPSAYDARGIGKAPVIKSQGELGTCWAITATSALEAAWMPAKDEVFSADHMSLNNGFVITQNEGGDYKMIMAYLSGWQGPVPESEDPYGDGVSPQGLAPASHVQDIVMMEDKSREQFKQMILSAGPVQTSLVMNRALTGEDYAYYQPETAAYYFPKPQTPDHDVLILGWDDNFSRESFREQPSQDGAWLCQNTWGEDFGQQGIFYVSYEDANIARSGLAYTRVDGPDNYDRIYQADVCGWQGKLGYEREYCYFANVFTAQSREDLRAVGFYSMGTQTAYEIYLVHGYADAGSFDKRRLLQTGTLSDIGYFTVDLDQPQPLEAGERYAVAVNIETKGAKRPVAVELKKDAYTAKVSLEGRESYISLYGGEWENTQESYQTNVCLKAYTDEAE